MQIIVRIILFIALLFLCEFYFTKKTLKAIRVVYPNFSEKKLKLLRKILLFFFNLYPLFVIIIWLYQSVASPASFYFPEGKILDYLLIYPFWFFIILAVQCVLLFAIIDIVKLLFSPLYKKYKFKILPFESKLFLLIISFFIIYVPLRMFYDYNTIETRFTEYKKANIPEVLNNFRIVLISDIHADRYTDSKRIIKFVNKINSAKPDVVFIGGDFISSTPVFIDTAAKYLGKINSKYGIYSCVGDHDNWAYRNDNARSRREITEALAKQNIFMYDNEQKTYMLDTARVGVTFVTNTYSKRITAKGIDTLASKAAGGYDLKIMLIHQPRQFVVDEAVKNNYDMLLAAHTHGGQITFFFPFINLTPTLIETKYIKGDFWFGKMLMVVNRGLGMSIAPVRYNSTPEITVIITKNKNANRK